MLKPQALTYIERQGWPAGSFGAMPQVLTPSKGPDTMLNRIVLPISTVEKCAPMQVVKQPEHRRASTTEEQKWNKRRTKGTKDEQTTVEQKRNYD